MLNKHQLQKEFVEPNIWRYCLKKHPQSGSLYAKDCPGYFLVGESLDVLKSNGGSVIEKSIAIREMRKRLEANISPIT